MKIADELVSRYTTSDERIAFFEGYRAGLSFAVALIGKAPEPAETVCPVCHGKGGSVKLESGAVVHYCNCAE